MRKSLPILGVLLLCSFIAQAQSISLIPKAGITLARTRYISGFNNYFPDEPDEDVHFVSRTGLAGGAGLEIGILKNNILALQPEVLFIQKGGMMKAYNSYLRFYEETSYTLNYLELPVLIKTSLQFQRLHLYANAGPSLGIGLGGNENYIGSKKPVSFNGSKEVGVTKRYDVSLQAGLGAGYHLGRISLLVEIRYGWGLTQHNVGQIALTPGSNSYYVNGIEFKNRFWMINTGIAVPLTNK